MFDGGGPLDEEEPVLLSKPLISSSSGAVAEVVPLQLSAVPRLLAKTPPAAAVARPERSLLADCFRSGDAVEAQTADCLRVIEKYQSIEIIIIYKELNEKKMKNENVYFQTHRSFYIIFS